VWLLQSTPPPSAADELHRSPRTVMDRAERRQFVAAFWPGLVLIGLVYIALTITRTLRDDFAVEIWHGMGVSETPSIFARTETVVGICVTALNALAILIPRNKLAIRITLGLMCGSFVLVCVSMLLQRAGRISPFGFMAACGIGLYVPYVAYHTTILERLIAASRRPCNFGFLMYLADSIGYLGYAVIITLKTAHMTTANVLPFFLQSSLVLAVLSIVSLLAAMIYFERVLPGEPELAVSTTTAAPAAELAPVE